MRIAVDEIHAFLLRSEMLVYLVVFDEKATKMGRNLNPDLEAYIDHNYVQVKSEKEYGDSWYGDSAAREETAAGRPGRPESAAGTAGRPAFLQSISRKEKEAAFRKFPEDAYPDEACSAAPMQLSPDEDSAIEEMERKLSERMEHMADTFPQYLLYLIHKKGMENAAVYKRAIVDKKVFSKIKNNPNYHPQKLTALCLCIGAKLNMDESRDLLARAGYALSPCDKTDIIFSYFIENGIYDMIELDIQLEEHGLPCIIT